MIKFYPDPTTFVSFYNLSIKWYAICILSGALIGYFFSRSDVKKIKHIDLDFFDNLFIYTLWFGIIGARLWFCIFYNFKFYLSNPVEIIKVWDGGLAIQGGLVAGAIFAYLYCKKHKVNFILILDSILPNVFIGQATGRWGNFINKECHGPEVAESYFDGILSFLKDGMLINGHYYEPMFFYESVGCLIGWILIHCLLKKTQNKRGDLTYAYLMWYGIIRFFIERKRTDSLFIGNLKMAMVTSVAFIIVGLLGYFGFFDKYVFKKKKPTIIFDMDGTVIDTSASIIEAYKEVFRQFGNIEDFTPERQVEVLGPALRDKFPIFFPGIPYDTLYEVYHNKQDAIKKQFNKVTENTENVMKTLHEEGYKIAILSTRTKEGIIDLLNDFNLGQYVDTIYGLKDVEKLKPNPEGIYKIVSEDGFNKDDVIMIGDSDMDVLCGKNYGAYSVGYVLNPGKSEQIAKSNPNRTITDMNELLTIVKEDHYFTYNLR